AEAGQILDAADLEPHEVLRVVRDALRVRLAEADAELRGEVEPLYSAVHPPSTIRFAPVTKEASSEARKSAACPISTGSATRRIICSRPRFGVVAASSRVRPCSPASRCTVALQTAPGQTPFTRIPSST